ncbi:MAG TPA: helix-turn-helix transcriptional regulator [Spirochaetota bacterium]|nr:helix-turn-helix transcriptional regulator [Spirochaetota bacterium]MBP8987391.1 helix-turn-helix transcriptional regulator [Spirochaetota bacterium]HOF13703.1 helix-turn-helix transcriptional regulator [Spirochaetota bacterium]HQL43668.1 helix-turn-helix transcriptional regulator [Spirochaetota bacterium]HQQ49809.1 helix-turn-helix transcriptional regulator [Spirochaetota bacterium]
MILFFRRKKNIKQVDMAKALNVSPSYLCKIERGVQEPTEEFKRMCARYLNISVSKLFPERVKNSKDVINDIVTAKNKLWNIRMAKGIKQYELAKLLHCSPSYLSKVEKGLQEPTDEFKKVCAKVLKVKEIEIFT